MNNLYVIRRLLWSSLLLIGITISAQYGPTDDLDGDLILNQDDLDDDNDGIPDSEEGGCASFFENAGFEEPVTNCPNGPSFSILPNDDVPGWYHSGLPGNRYVCGSNTGILDGLIEIWESGLFGVTANEGNQFAEINGNNTGTLYQLFAIPGPGSYVLEYGFAHRGRAGDDTMRFGVVENGTFIASEEFTSSNTEWSEYYGSIPYTSNAGNTIEVGFEAISTASGSTGSGNFIDAVRICLSLDSDGDGIPDHQDLDSDNDGCPDALEAGGSTFTYANLNLDGSLNLTVDGDGIPNSVSNTEGSSIDPTVQADECDSCNSNSTKFTDSDGDTIGDDCDLDDDNDGVLDATECPVERVTLISENLAVLTPGANALDLQTGNQLIKSSAFTYNDTTYDIIITLDEVNITTGTLEINTGGGLRMKGVVPDEASNVVYTIDIVETGTTNPVLFQNLTMLIRDIDGASSNVHEITGFQTAVMPNEITFGPQLRYDSFDFGNTDSFETYTNLDGTLGVSSIDPNHWVILNYDSYTSSKFIFGVKPEGSDTFNRTMFHDLFVPCDADEDGIPNHIDLDSDQDGCPDVSEAGVVQYISDNSLDVTLNSVQGNDENGIPTGTTLNNAQIDTTNGNDAIGPDNGFHDALEASAAGNFDGTYLDLNQYYFNPLEGNCVCYKPGTGAFLSSKVGISTLNRHNATDTNQWPENVSSGYLVLDSKEKGFVITSLSSADIDTLDAQEGMLVYDLDLECLKLYNGSEWHCLEQTCIDN